tara:strand:+ start:24624 stop:28427 length:3804 start_codon:yes stop_codon:yes gene_type:complete
MTIYLTPPSGGGAASVPSATTTVEGKVRLATTTEAQDVNNETLAVTPKALNAQINSAIVGGIEYKGSIDAANIPTALVNANQGDFYKISVANASVAGTDWDIGDNLIVNTDMGSTFDAAKIDKIDSTDADLATVATSGSFGDLLNVPTASATVQGIVELATDSETATGTDSARAVTPAGLSSVLGDYSQTLEVIPTTSHVSATLNKAYYITASAGAAVTLTLPSVSSASSGDVVVVTRKNSGNLTIVQNGSDTGSLVNYGSTGGGSTHTISNNGQELFIRFNSVGSNWFIFETANHAVATSGDYTDLTNKPTSDDITSDHTGVNYTGAQNASITTHLSGIDQAIANALGGTSDKIEEGQAKVEVVDTAGNDDATIQFWADPNNDGTSEKIWEFDKDGHLIPDVNATYDIGKADKKVRHLFLSDNSLQFGASNSNAITGTVSATSTHLKYKSVNLATEDYVDTQLGDYTESTALATVATSGSFADLSNVPTASDSAQGIVELADNTETATGTNSTKAVTPAGLTHKLGDYTPTSGLSTVATSNDYNDLDNEPTLGTAAALDHGTGANQIVKLDVNSKLPAVDGSALINLPSGSSFSTRIESGATVTAVANEFLFLTNNSSSGIDVTLPANPSEGDFVALSKQSSTNSSANEDPTGGTSVVEIFEGATKLRTIDLPSGQGTVFIVYDSTTSAWTFPTTGLNVVEDSNTFVTPFATAFGNKAYILTRNGNVEFYCPQASQVIEGRKQRIYKAYAGTLTILSYNGSATEIYDPLTNSNVASLVVAGHGCFVDILRNASGQYIVSAPLQGALLKDISNVNITNIQANQTLSWDGTNSQWINSTASSGGASQLDGLSDVTITSASAGQVLRHNNSNFVNAQLAYSDLSGTPTLGTAAELDHGTSANQIVRLDGSGKLPQVDGSALTNLPSGSSFSARTISNNVAITANKNEFIFFKVSAWITPHNLTLPSNPSDGDFVALSRQSSDLSSANEAPQNHSSIVDIYEGSTKLRTISVDADTGTIFIVYDGASGTGWRFPTTGTDVTEHTSQSVLNFGSLFGASLQLLTYNGDVTYKLYDASYLIEGRRQRLYKTRPGSLTIETNNSLSNIIYDPNTNTYVNSVTVAGHGCFVDIFINKDNQYIVSAPLQGALLKDISNVNITNIQANQTLSWDGTNSQWINRTAGWNFSAITSNTTAQAGYHYSCGAGDETFTVTLPNSGVVAGQEIRVKNVGTGTITIARNGHNIEGAASNYTLDAQFSSITLVWNGSNNWELV